MSGSQLLKVFDEIPLAYGNFAAVSVIHSALHAQHTNAQYLVRWNMGGFLLSPEKAAAIATKLQTRIETIQQKAFEAGHLICLHSHQVPGDPLKRIVVETLLYSKELFLAVMQDPQHPRPIKSVNDALASKGKQAPHLTDEQKQFCDNLVAGKLEGWCVKGHGGQVQSVILTGLEALAAKAHQPKHVGLLLFFCELLPEIAKGVIDKSVPLTSADVAVLKEVLLAQPDENLKAALLLSEVRQANAGTLDPLIDAIKNCPKLNKILLELIESARASRAHAAESSASGGFKAFPWRSSCQTSRGCEKNRSVDAQPLLV